MKPNDLPDLDERLWEWAFYFRDRKRLESCRSIEHRYKRHSDDYEQEGIGELAPPTAQPERSYRLPRAVETNDVIHSLDRRYKWALTYHYCYPGLPRSLILRWMKRYAQVQFKWKDYLEVLEIGKFRVYALLARTSQ